MSSRIVAENALSLTNIVTPPYFDLMELDDLTRRPSAGDMPTLGQLLKHVGDVRKEASGDGSETPVHHALDIPGIEPRSLPFVLSFSNLTMLPLCAILCSTFTTMYALVESSPEVGSSRNRRIGSWIMSVPIDTLRRSPPETPRWPSSPMTVFAAFRRPS